MSGIDELLAVMAMLRDPQGGCPWDREQDFRSLVSHTLEEAYEVADAIEQGDMAELRAELGDLLFQVVFYAQIAKEQGLFDFDMVASSIVDKLKRRHPHVFGDVEIADAHAQTQAWEQYKTQERADKAKQLGKAESALDGVSLALPALVRAEKLQRRAARTGFDWDHWQGVVDKVREELDELSEACETAPMSIQVEEELGDLLFSVVNLSRHLGMGAEGALRGANLKFQRRFQSMESLCRQQGTALDKLGPDQREALWQQVKRAENGDDTPINA